MIIWYEGNSLHQYKQDCRLGGEISKSQKKDHANKARTVNVNVNVQRSDFGCGERRMMDKRGGNVMFSQRSSLCMLEKLKISCTNYTNNRERLCYCQGLRTTGKNQCDLHCTWCSVETRESFPSPRSMAAYSTSRQIDHCSLWSPSWESLLYCRKCCWICRWWRSLGT